MSFLFENNAVSTLLAGITNIATTLTVQAGHGARFPNPTGGDSFRCTLQDASNNIEIVNVTSRATDVFTIVRAQEGTTGLAWLAGDVVELRLTKEILATYRQGNGDEVQTTAISRAVGAVDVHDIIECTAAATITLADAATMAQGYQIHIKNNGTGNVTLARATGADTIDNVAANKILFPGESSYLAVNATDDGYTSLYADTGLERAWPVGSIHLSTTITNPNTTMGFGTWVQIAKGRTLLGEGTGAGLTARVAAAELGQEDAIVPAHTHTVTDPGHIHASNSNVENGNLGATNSVNSRATASTNNTNSAVTGLTVDSEGVSVTDANMQPSLVVYIWERTA